MRKAALFFLFLLACTEQVREKPRETPLEESFTYRISTEEQQLLEAPESSIELARVPLGAVVAETGPRGKPWTEEKNGVSWVNVAYRGDVGWLKTASTEKPFALASTASAHEFGGTWLDSQTCAGRPAFLSIEPWGTFSGMRCEYCDINGCPNIVSGTWKTQENLLCLEERKGERACFFVWRNLLVAFPERGFLWEYHGGAALSGLARQ